MEDKEFKDWKEVIERNRSGTCRECLEQSNDKGDMAAMCYGNTYCPATHKRANKHLEQCTEICKMNPSGICAFSLRNSHGCYLDPEVQKASAELFANAIIVNTIQRAKEFVRGKL